MTRIRRYSILLFVWLRLFSLKLDTNYSESLMSTEATALDGAEEQDPVTTKAVEQEPQQSDPASTEEPVGNLDGDDTADSDPDSQ